jgi:hypothetical protein
MPDPVLLLESEGALLLQAPPEPLELQKGAAMGVGFKLPTNRVVYSRMTHLPAPYKINTAFDPEAYAAGSPNWTKAVQGRYGTPLDPWLPFDSAPGLHSSAYTDALATIAAGNPGWFAQRGYGAATGATSTEDVSFNEEHDAYYASGINDEVIQEAARLGAGVPPDEEEDDPLSMPTAEMKDTASKLVSWIPVNRPKRRQLADELARWVNSRPTRP